MASARLLSRGGLTLDPVAKQPAHSVNAFSFALPAAHRRASPYDVPQGFSIRHAKGIDPKVIDVDNRKEDRRPASVLDSVEGVEPQNCNTRGNTRE
jgi:hypothetical protein